MARSRRKKRRRVSYERNANVLTLPTQIDRDIDEMVYGTSVNAPYHVHQQRQAQLDAYLNAPVVVDLDNWDDSYFPDPTYLPEGFDYVTPDGKKFIPQWYRGPLLEKPDLNEDFSKYYPKGHYMNPFEKARSRSLKKQAAAAAALNTNSKAYICAQREIREEVLHATQKTGKVGQKRPIWTKKSKITCKE